jgi:predicted nucleic acid-binding protein
MIWLMRVVSNTSPVSNLAIIGRLELLRAKYGRVVIPQAVKEELARLSHSAGATAIQRALAEGWLVVEAVADRRVLPVLMACVNAGSSFPVSWSA